MACRQCHKVIDLRSEQRILCDEKRVEAHIYQASKRSYDGRSDGFFGLARPANRSARSGWLRERAYGAGGRYSADWHVYPSGHIAKCSNGNWQKIMGRQLENIRQCDG
jgi:hypothetical protein